MTLKYVHRGVLTTYDVKFQVGYKVLFMIIAHKHE